MNKKICFLNTETTGLHQTYENVSKKKLYCFARLVIINYEIGHFKNDEYILEKKVRQIAKPRCMVIPEETIVYHGITQKKANKRGIDPEQIILDLKKDLENVDIIISHNVDFHLKTILAESIRYNIQLEFNKFVIIDTISFNHNFGFIKLRDLATKLSITDIPDKPKYNVELIRNIFIILYKKFQKSIKT